MASNRPEKIQPVDFIEGLYKKNVKSEELLQIFVKNMNMFHSSIYDKKLSDDSLSLLVHLIARVCDCTKQKRNREICQLLNMLSASPLFKNRSNTLLLGKTCNYSCDHSFQCLLSDFLTILQEIYLRIPRLSTTPQVMRLGEHLKEQISECDDLEDKGMMMDIVMETMKGIRHITGERSRAKQDAEDKFLPPDDFRTVSVIPEQNDILNIPKFLRRNKVCGKYMNLDHYLDVQFRLYREDCVSPLRDALLEFKQKDKADRKENIRLEHGLLYKNVKVMKQIISIDSGEVFEIKLDPEHRKRVNWGNGKRLIYGTLLLISFDRFNTVFVAIVAESETKILQKKGSFTVQVFRYGNKQNLPRNTDGIIIESNSSYFEAYRHVLKALQQIREETSPFTKYLVHCENKVRFLSYISKHHVYDLRPVIKNCRIDLDNTNRRTLRNTFLKQTPINIATLSEEDWPSTEMLKMDESQRKAFIAALTKEFVLIQGPPGTGKTYLALQIAKTLLHNTNRLNMNSKGKDEKYTRNARIIATKPYMLVVCYTNHALDQFVQGIIDFMPETPSGHRCFPEIVRFGSRSKNPKFEELSIKNLRSRVRLKPHFPRDEVLKEASKAKRKIKEIRKTIEALKSKNIVLWFDEIKCVLTKNFASQFGEKFVWLQWLNVSEQSWYEEVNKQYQNQRNDEAIKNLLGGFAAELEEVEFVSLISEKETAYSVRYLEVDDVDFSLNTDTIGLDLDMQYENELHKTNKLEKKCKLILRLEKEKAARELHYGKAMSEGQVKQIKSIWKLSIKDRWKMYRYWLMQYVKILHEQLRKSEKEFHDIFDDYRHNSIEKDEIIMKQATVLAMTTTSAARYRESLSKVDPLITIIEEAAEVPEAHIVTAISPRCKHLILIGDHKQLQPKPAVHELAIKFNLSVSLFERMVMNNLSYYCLQRQHRMRPEISELVRHIYHTLYDNENVYEYPPIKGVHKSLYFITHNKQEAFKDEGRSFSNEYEAEYLKELYLYLLKQRYEPSEITILTAYAGQTSCLEGKLPSSKFKGVKICVLDNYQGEENEIILLSLVRSNTTGDIGFLNRENRICVALSRAKQGLFIIGNSDTLTKKSQHWQTVIGKLQMQENVNDINKTSPIYQGIGKGLPLYCQNHPKKKGILAESPSDFKKVKDGGCDIPCEFRLPCGHECRYDCHPFDKEHKTYKCKKQCTLTCVEGHKCFKRCHYADECRCSVEMKRELKCHHTIFLQCHVHYSKYPCPFKVSRTLLCGHTSSIECHVDPNTVLCTVSVDRELECGHTAQLNCHIDPNRHECAMILTETRSKCGHKFERRCHDANYEILNKCKVLINEKRTSCDHLIERNCFDTTYEMRIDCSITVTMNRSSCGHEYQRQCHDRMYAMSHKCIDIVTEQWSSCKHYYKRHCFESDFVMRHTCQSKTVDKRIDCGHEFVRTCSDTNYQHKHKCCVYVEKNVPKCGHKVKLPCHQDVSTVKCKESVTKVLDCKHVNRYECFKIDTIKCKVKCNKICINGHVCTKTCHFPTPCDCQELIKTILEGCKHQQTIPCSIDSKVYPCKTMVKKVLNKCQHLQYMQCHIDPETIRCTFAVLKSLPKCGHEEMVFCSENLSGAICTKEVEIKLDKCGHSVGIKCWQKKYMPLQEVKCFEPTLHTRSDCGHITTIPCWEISSHDFTPCQKLLDTTLSCGHVIKSVCSVEEETICDKRCDKPLSCGHPCPGVCHECDHNQDCSRQCERELVCGHACPSEVCMMCTPCQNSCSFACSHSKCPTPCIDSCKPCKENCSWVCQHRKCTKLCFEECNRQRCCNDCDKILSCGHQCPGYCGEPCPLECAICKPKMYVLKYNYILDEKIVTFVQCGHSFGSIYLDDCMDEMKNRLVSKCPWCRAIISYHPRYEQILKRQKLAIEDTKLKIRKVRVNSQTIYPACDAGMLTSFEQYTTSIATYLHIIQQTQRKMEFDQEFHDIGKLVESILEDIETTEATSFKTCLQLSEKIFSLYVQWILCLFTTKPELMDKFYIADWFPALKKLTSKHLNNFWPEVVESLECYLEKNDRISTDINGHRTIMSRSIVAIVRSLKTLLNQDKISEILKPFIADMEGDGYLANTKIYPKLNNVVGIHSSDWTICRNGHSVSTILDSSCKICDGPDNHRTEFRYDNRHNEVTHGLTKESGAQLGKSQVSNVRGKRSNFCKDNSADISEDFGNMYSRPRVRNPTGNKSCRENFRCGRGQNLRGRGANSKSTEKAMQGKSSNEKTRRSDKNYQMHPLPSLKSDNESYHTEDGEDKHNIKSFPSKALVTGSDNSKSDSNGAGSGVSKHDSVPGHEDITDGNESSGSRRLELSRGGHRGHYHFRGYSGRGRGRGGIMGKGRGSISK